MSLGSDRTGRIAAGCAAMATTAVLAASAGTGPAFASSGLESAVGPIPRATAALLPSDRKLWASYGLADTPDACKRGAISCVDTTINGMYQRFNPLARACHHSAVFSLLYLRVTERYRIDAATPGYFISAPTVNREDTDFAVLETKAFNRWYAGSSQSVPPVWRLAFAAADAKKVTGSGDAFLGMVSHIKRDLPFALWRIAQGSHADHFKINDMLKEVYPTASVELARRFDPTMGPQENVPGMGETLVDAIATWREQAWQDAHDLLTAADATAFHAVAMRIERAAWQSALTIYLAMPATAAQNTVRDDYCRNQQQTGAEPNVP
ncbi:MAG: DUF5995 family protein [Frankiaceae bacterium]